MAAHRFLSLAGVDLSDNVLGNLFADVQAGSAVDVAYVQVVNNTPGTQTAARAWLSIDSAGCVVNLAVADNTPRAASYSYSATTPTFPGTPPSSYATGVTLTDLPTGQKLLLAVRRDPTGATAASPETNALVVQCQGPA